MGRMVWRISWQALFYHWKKKNCGVMDMYIMSFKHCRKQFSYHGWTRLTKNHLDSNQVLLRSSRCPGRPGETPKAVQQHEGNRWMLCVSSCSTFNECGPLEYLCWAVVWSIRHLLRWWTELKLNQLHQLECSTEANYSRNHGMLLWLRMMSVWWSAFMEPSRWMLHIA